MGFLEEAANLGHPDAQDLMALELGYSGSEDDGQKAVLYATLALNQGMNFTHRVPHIFNYLGSCFDKGSCGLAKSPYLAKHYFELGAKLLTNRGFSVNTEIDAIMSADVTFNLATKILQIESSQYEDKIWIPGHSCVPEVLYWFRKSLQIDNTKNECTVATSTTAKSTRYIEILE